MNDKNIKLSYMDIRDGNWTTIAFYASKERAALAKASLSLAFPNVIFEIQEEALVTA